MLFLSIANKQLSKDVIKQNGGAVQNIKIGKERWYNLREFKIFYVDYVLYQLQRKITFGAMVLKFFHSRAGCTDCKALPSLFLYSHGYYLFLRSGKLTNT